MENSDITPAFVASIPTYVIIQARGWVADCEWGDLPPRRVAQLSRLTLVRGVNRHYEGGWEQFIADQDAEASIR